MGHNMDVPRNRRTYIYIEPKLRIDHSSNGWILRNGGILYNPPGRQSFLRGHGTKRSDWIGTGRGLAQKNVTPTGQFGKNYLGDAGTKLLPTTRVD